ncbi:hypothetical protein P8452_57648 [Trifolium repens]|nr:hypothetical protein P8452_57648 [Trifolium repens]
MVLKNNGSKRTQPPCFVKLKTLKVLCPSPKISDDRLREMTTYLLQNSPPNTFDIIKFHIIRNVDYTFNKCLFHGMLLMQKVWHNEV